MTQKECHQAWNNMYDPNDPNKCCSRGPIFNSDKHIREIVLQYNLKHPEVPKHSTDKEDTYNTSKTPPPPDLTELPTPLPKCSYTKVSIPSEKTPQTTTIESLIKYIANMETDISLGTDNEVENTEVMITSKLSPI